MQREYDALSVEVILNPEAQQDAFTRRMHDEHQFVGAKRLADGTYVGVTRLLYTLAICIGVGEHTAYTRRYCYEDAATCLMEYQLLESGSDVPQGWIAKRPA